MGKPKMELPTGPQENALHLHAVRARSEALPFANNSQPFGSFNAEATHPMGFAFERAWQMIETSSAVIIAECRALPTRVALVRQIYDLAREGERDPTHQCDRALARLFSG
jgi:hypothetical protein